MSKLVELKMSMYMTVEEKYLDELKKIADHHIEYLMDLENHPEIKSVCGVTIEEEKS